MNSGGDAAMESARAGDRPARHARQARFGPLGEDGQARIARARVLVVGIGAIGTHLAESMLRAGVGHLELVDRDVVELQNLQRQTLFDEDDAREGRPKAIAALRRLRTIDSGIEIRAHVADFDAACWDALPQRPDLVLDGTDNFATRYLINDLAVRDGVPWIYGAVVGASGRCAVVLPGITPCLRCLLEQPPDGFELGTCETVGVIEPAVAMIAALQATAALKILGGKTEDLTAGLTSFDLWHGSYRRSFEGVRPRGDCASCGTRSFPALAAPTTHAVVLCGRDTVQIRPPRPRQLDLDAIGTALEGAVPRVERTPHLLRIEADGCRISLFADGRALVFGTADTLRARALYDRWIGVS